MSLRTRYQLWRNRRVIGRLQTTLRVRYQPPEEALDPKELVEITVAIRRENIDRWIKCEHFRVMTRPDGAYTVVSMQRQDQS